MTHHTFTSACGFRMTVSDTKEQKSLRHWRMSRTRRFLAQLGYAIIVSTKALGFLVILPFMLAAGLRRHSHSMMAVTGIGFALVTSSITV